MSKTTWAKVVPEDIVTVNGRPYVVAKVKAKGKSVKVTLADVKTGRTFDGKMSAADKVELGKLHEPIGQGNAQRRWAKPHEAEPPRRKGLEPGDPSVTKRPEKPSGDDWAEPRDKVERKLEAILGARLVAEGDGAVGYYVPPVDVTTIAAHLALCHPNTYDAEKDEATMLAGHDHEHRMVLDGKARLDVNHWHTKTRPAAGA